MDTQTPQALHPSPPLAWLPLASLLLASLVLFGLAGCASPGEPTERRPPTPQAVGDLAASQLGNSVELTFTLPDETLDHHPLAQVPTIEIFRDFSPATSGAVTSGASGSGAAEKAAAPANLKQPSLLVTIPSDAVSGYEERGHIRYTDLFKPEDFTQHPDSIATYIVRTRVSAKRDSANSNAASLRIYPAPNPIDDLKGEFTHAGVELSWSAPQQTSVRAAPPILRYSIYRSLSATTSSPTSASDTSGEQEKAVQPSPAAAKIGESDSTSYLDAQFESGSTYTYFVRSAMQYGAASIESGDSNLVMVTARDTFPPAAPQGIVVVPIPAQSGQSAYLELSWRISPETDVAGYNVYRSEDVGAPGTRINTALLPSPTFRDMNTVPGRRYFYSVTAVDRSGNESAPSIAVFGTAPAEN